MKITKEHFRKGFSITAAVALIAFGVTTLDPAGDFHLSPADTANHRSLSPAVDERGRATRTFAPGSAVFKHGGATSSVAATQVPGVFPPKAADAA